ncbi:MAG TPA: sulfatase-like hydrolase/transferase, partial [Chitinophagales bacterium]|nr:sulfatase-like hydrolase/transferase [Chitinophagales bacterium]
MNRLSICLIVLLFAPLSLLSQNCQLNPPSGLKMYDITSCSAGLKWKSVPNVSKYQVRYKLATSSQWSNWIKTKKDTFYVFTGLNAGKKYDFNVQAKCTDGSQSAAVSKSAKTLACTLPDEVNIVPLNSTSVKITLQADCPFTTLNVRYTNMSGISTIKAFAPAASYEVNGLLPDASYLFEVTTCKLNQNNWTVPQSVHLPKLPNIVFILIDDARADYFSCCGAFPFFKTPNVDRIAQEGVNFKRSYVVTSMCAPSRAAIATGLFTLKNGVFENGSELDTSFTTLPQVLQQHGYYTALVGKNHGTFLIDGKDEFDYSLESHDENQGQINFLYNGVIKIINKPNVETLTDSAIALIERVDEPLFLWLAYRTPHYPNAPLAKYEGTMDNVIFPWKPDTARYSINYPSFIYDNPNEVVHGEDLDSTYRNLLEVVEGLDSCVGILFDAMEDAGKLDNTLLIFMSDNGFTLGSHWLNGKSLAYEPSMHVPLLVRYPEWFAAGTVIKDRMAVNLDIAPTIYEAAGVDYQEPLDGHSLRSLYDGSFNRTSYYYLMYNNLPNGAPSKRAVRDMKYKYINYTCSVDTVEEFYDMINDSLELNNLINNHVYDVLVQQYRLKFDSMRIVYGDTAPEPLKNCYLKNPFYLKEYVENTEQPQTQPLIYPTVACEGVEVYIPWKSATAVLYNELGQVAGTWD